MSASVVFRRNIDFIFFRKYISFICMMVSSLHRIAKVLLSPRDKLQPSVLSSPLRQLTVRFPIPATIRIRSSTGAAAVGFPHIQLPWSPR
jgi:multisubunit Na+/H+ antiporter MnhE subunit